MVSSDTIDSSGTLKKGALNGIRVVDVSRALAGPFTTMLMGDLGADVIKLEMPGTGDESRYWGPPFATYMSSNRNKRSAEVDLHTEEGRNICLDLIRNADVLVENFRPGTMKRFKLDYETVAKIKPDLIYCSISAYGQTGPMSHRPGIDLMVQAVSGLMSQTGEPDGRAMKAGGPIADIVGGFSAVVSIMASLMERRETGRGRYIDIAMLDALMMVLNQQIVTYTATGKPYARVGNAHPLMAPYESFPASDREFVMAVTNEKAWKAFISIPEFAHLDEVPEFRAQVDRNINRVKMLEEIYRVFRAKPAEYWLAELDKRGIPSEPILTLPEVVSHPHIRERGSLMEIEYPPGSGTRVVIPGMPWRDVAAPRIQRDPPGLGQHTREVLEELYGPGGIKAAG
ncbi:CaiB/BaiF CoA transferase family protein [Chelatococcus asaccharovorans]|uniref:CaiB/BaiF CoA transferase family protein n=1 Tax=Chelatococcus asaccharovorans TaxID=28210 RepID=UPI00224C7129|nr:CoA transferase [Chelatococcus asaccharovorans]CAH1650756.1 Formyl-CoA transferase/CoA:oxalate CoA-transferase [Chelatococcus asaccharovorans]CAH1692515.1 Formyl-CoA transferase/CoA:oxalate CoA-transferase [Chelatococcus asaccharovorans]